MRYAFNLSAVAAELPDSAVYERFQKLVKTASSIESTISDLEDCSTAIAEARRLMGERNLQAVEMLLEALMVYAVITYSRATHSTPIDRFFVGVGKRPEHLREAHKTIVALRDRVFAHYGHGADQPDGLWRHEPLIMVAEGNRIQFGFPSERATFRERVIDEIAELVQTGIPQLQQTCAAKQAELTEEIEALGENDEFVQVARRHPFDEDVFFARRT